MFYRFQKKKKNELLDTSYILVLSELTPFSENSIAIPMDQSLLNSNLEYYTRLTWRTNLFRLRKKM